MLEESVGSRKGFTRRGYPKDFDAYKRHDIPAKILTEINTSRANSWCAMLGIK
jgi:hypothetical protein